MSWTPQILYDKIKQSASIQAQQPTAWDWIDGFKKEKNAILLVFDVLRTCTDLDVFRLTVMLLKKIIDGLVSVLQTQDILAFIELLMNITTKVVINDKPTLNNLCYVLAKLATRTNTNIVSVLFNHFKQSTSPEFTQYYNLYFLHFLYESLMILEEKQTDDETLMSYFKSMCKDLLDYLDGNINVHFNLTVDCFRLGNKLNIFQLSDGRLYSSRIFLFLFEALLNPTLINSSDLASLPVNIEMILNKLKRMGGVQNYQFYNTFYANFVNVLRNRTQQSIYSMYDDDEFVFNLYYMTYAIVNIHEGDISQLLLQQTNTFEAIPILEMTIYCMHKINISKAVSCLSIWRDLLYLCREKVIAKKSNEWGSLQLNLLVSHYYIYYLKSVMLAVYNFASDGDNLEKGFYRLHQGFLAFFDRPPLQEQMISSYMIENYIKPNAISVQINNTTLTLLNTKGFIGVVFMKPSTRHEFLPLMKTVIDNQLYRLDNVYSDDPFLHMALIELLTDSVDLCGDNNKGFSSITTIAKESFQVATPNAMTYFLYLYDCCPKYNHSLYDKLIRCSNRIFHQDPTSFQLYLPKFIDIINKAYNNADKTMINVSIDVLDHCVDFAVGVLAKRCDINPMLTMLFTPHIDVLSGAIQRGKLNKNALQFLKAGLEALDINSSKDFYIQLVKNMLPVFLAILTSNVHDHAIIEITCSCLRRMIRDMGTYFGPYLESLIEAIKKAYKTNYHPTYLYISSVVVDEFGQFANNDPLIAVSINNLIVAMFDIALPNMCTFECGGITDAALQNHVDQTVEDFFVLTKRLLKVYPDPFFNYSKLETLCDVAIKFLARNDSYTVSALTSFWSVLMELVTRSLNTVHKETAAQIILVYMPKIVFTIMSEMIQFPVYSMLDPYCDLLYGMKNCDPNLYVQSLNLTIAQIRNNDHIPAHVAVVEEISKESLAQNNPDTLVDVCERTFLKHI